MNSTAGHDGPRPYWNPYLAGVLLGVTLLATFLVAGQGLGASAFPKRVLALGAAEVAPAWTAESAALGKYVADGANPLRNWLVVEVVGVFLGGMLGREPETRDAVVRAVDALIEAGRIRPHVSRVYSLDEAPEALRDLLDRRVFGKVVVAP